MTPITRIPALVLTSLALAGCPPQLTGATCRTDCDCPLAETCSETNGSLTCQNGTNLSIQLPDGGCASDQDGGEPGADGGAGLFGNVTLNGGWAKPAGNDAWVYIWSQNPDGGAQPVTTVATDARGHFSYPQADGTTSYYLLAEYNIDASGQLHDPTDKLQSAGPVQAGQSPVSLDVQTASCAIFANHSAADNTPRLWEAIADIPDVQTGLELTTGVTAIVSYAGGEQTLQYQPASTGDPLSAGRWAYIPGSAVTRPAAQATYDFKLTAPSYNNAACNVTRTSPPGPPTAVGIAIDGGTPDNTWDSAASAGDTVEWQPPDGVTLSLVTLAAPLTASTPSMTIATDGGTYTFKGNTIPEAACPSTGAIAKCTCDVTSILAQVTGNALSLEGAFSEIDFQTE